MGGEGGTNKNLEGKEVCVSAGTDGRVLSRNALRITGGRRATGRVRGIQNESKERGKKE